MSVDVSRYLAMERAEYATLVARSKFEDEAFTEADRVEFVVGSYAQQERFDYERWLLGGLTIGPDALALEYGCGPGRMVLRLTPLFNRVDGMDISPEVVEVARRRCQGISNPPRLMVTDGQSVPVEPGSYDLAYSVICLQHICVHAVRRRIFEGLFQALKPGGVLTFQMGYGPGHAARVDYFANYLDAKGTNGAVDVTVLHPAELATDLCEIGFVSPSFALTPTGPGDTHGAWIFLRVVKPGSSASVAFSEGDWREAGFEPVNMDVADLRRARQRQNARGLMKRSRDEAVTIDALRRRLDEQTGEHKTAHEKWMAREGELERQLSAGAATVADIERERDRLEDALAFATADRAACAQRLDVVISELEQRRRGTESHERQLRRVRIADRRRLRALIEGLVADADAGDLAVGVLGCGAFTEWLLAETPLASIARLRFFESDPARVGGRIAGHDIHSSADLAPATLDVVVASSLAFQDEMVQFLESLPIRPARIVRCYP